MHFTVVLAGGHQYRALTVGQAVRFGFEEVEQDGYAYRATWVGSFGNGKLHRPDPSADAGGRGSSQAHSSTLIITYDYDYDYDYDHDHDRDDEDVGKGAS